MLAYHFTDSRNVESILKHGLKIDYYDKGWLGLSGIYRHDFIYDYDGHWPIFLALPDTSINYLFYNNRAEILEVDITGYTMYPDLPTFQSEQMDFNWNSLVNDFYNARNSIHEDMERNRRIIEATRTFCVLNDIPPTRISR